MNQFAKDLIQSYPKNLRQALADVLVQRKSPLYLTGGTVRDLYLARSVTDLDFTVPSDGFGWAKDLSERLAARFIPLDSEEDVARVVWQGITIDFSGFREGAKTIEEDLAKRDFAINSMALSCEYRVGREPDLIFSDTVIDPAGGLKDLEKGIIRCVDPKAFISDPLRLLRAYRFMACLDFTIDPATAEKIQKHADLILTVSAERISHELWLIMSVQHAFAAIKALYASGLFRELFPELMLGIGMQQPDSHHLDVFSHSLEAFRHMEYILQSPVQYFPVHAEAMNLLCEDDRKKAGLKWAALFHDIGKPGTIKVREDKDDRITFYNHDMVGGKCFTGIAERLKWSREDILWIRRLIEMHMWPFHLNNVRRQSEITARAALRLIKAAGSSWPALFMLTMADCLAGKGEGRPPNMEQEIAALYNHIFQTYQQNIMPVLEKPVLLSGHDLKKIFNLVPGPVFKYILEGLQQAQVAHEIETREDAIQWVHAFLHEKG